jgi:hypothetical protein
LECVLDSAKDGLPGPGASYPRRIYVGSGVVRRLSTIGLGVSIGATLWYLLYSHSRMVELHHNNLPIRSLSLIW